MKDRKLIEALKREYGPAWEDPKLRWLRDLLEGKKPSKVVAMK